MVKKLQKSLRDTALFLSSYPVVNHVSQSWIFMIGMTFGVIVDLIFYYIDEYALKEYPKLEQSRLFTFVVGFMQIFINIVVIRVSKFYNVNGDLFITGIFLPQTLLIQRLYRKD